MPDFDQEPVVDWIEFIAALAAFFIAHWAPLRPGLRAPLKRMLGQTGFTWIYSVLSLGLLAWLIAATNRAPRLMIWPWALWQNLLVLGAMAAAVLILALTLGRPNPFSFGGGGPAPFDPTRPGLTRWIRHPILTALALWALAHLVANGDLAHVVLFGLLGAMALIGQTMIDRRDGARRLNLWRDMRGATRDAPFLSLFRPSDLWRGLAGLACYGTLILLHPWLIGVDPLAGLSG